MPTAARRSKTRLFLILAFGLLIAWLIFSHFAQSGKQQAGKEKRHATPVTIAQVKEESIVKSLDAMGTVESPASITLKPQVEGRILRIAFHEGDFVQKGQLLFELDAQPFQAAVAQARGIAAQAQSQISQARVQLEKDRALISQNQAVLRRDQAQAQFARAQSVRYQQLLKQDFLSKNEVEQAVSSARSAEQTVHADREAIQSAQATLHADQAAVRSAQANYESQQAAVEAAAVKLAYCKIFAPMSGKTGALMAHVGDVVEANVTSLITLNQVNPIYIAFSLPEAQFSQLRQVKNWQALTVHARTRDNHAVNLPGRLLFMNNTVDPTTGAIQLKAVYHNPADARQSFWPGEYVDVSLVLGRQPKAIAIPSAAVQTGQRGDYVLTVNPDDPHPKAVLRWVTVDQITQTQAVVLKGLQVGDWVITEGQFAATPGEEVRISTQHSRGTAPEGATQ